MELEKRGLTGKIDDPLLNSHAQSKPNDKNEGMAGEDSLMLGGMCYDEESQSVRGADTSGRRPPPPKPGYTVS